jgi:hypothetical protein
MAELRAAAQYPIAIALAWPYRWGMLLWSTSIKPMRLTPYGEATMSFGRQAHVDIEPSRVRWRD